VTEWALRLLDAKLRQWQKKHDTPAKVAAAHRKVLLQRVVESMAFENEPVCRPSEGSRKEKKERSRFIGRSLVA
jgi:hypothetical protein